MATGCVIGMISSFAVCWVDNRAKDFCPAPNGDCSMKDRSHCLVIKRRLLLITVVVFVVFVGAQFQLHNNTEYNYNSLSDHCDNTWDSFIHSFIMFIKQSWQNAAMIT